MSEKVARGLHSEVQQFSARLAKSGWIDSSDRLADGKSPTDLFKAEERPLVVGLFGGTGVGKSSLLNRIAASDIARTGVVRPTSMEITAYLHRDVQLDALPEHFDAASFSSNRHENDSLADVMWVDMPDFDSHETDNKDQVFQWLPHLDLLLYVVTPERYKDAEGWRMLIDNGYRHAWLFVINQWDRADSLQYEDFSSLLEAAGFSAPQIFRTVCVGQHTDDQFDEMITVIEALSKQSVVKHLQERGWMQRLERSKIQLKKHTALLATERAASVLESFDTHWQEFVQSAVSHLDGPFKAYSEQFSEDKTGAVGNVLKSITGKASTENIANNISIRKDAGSLWDDWLNVRCQDSVQQFKLAQSEHNIPKKVFASLDDSAVTNNQSLMAKHLNQAVNDAIKQPGSKAQRLVAKVASVAKILLPLLAFVWIAWRVINGFITGAEDRTAYVGFDFMINGLLLAGLGWLIPVIVARLFVPSLPDSVYSSLHQGLQGGLREIEQSVHALLEQVTNERASCLSDCADLQKNLDNLLDTAAAAPSPMVSRALMASRE